LEKCLYYSVPELVPSYLPNVITTSRHKHIHHISPNSDCLFFIGVFTEKKFRRFDKIMNKFLRQANKQLKIICMTEYNLLQEMTCP